MSKICAQCKKEFKTKVKVDGKWRTLNNRKRCLECQPFGEKIKKDVILHKCKKCEKEFKVKSSNQIFCSQSCAASFNNTGKKRRLSTYYCKNCNKELHGRGKKYCNLKCMVEYRTECITTNFSMCNIVPVKETLKKIIIRINGYECAHCGISSWNNKKLVLEIEHIDGNSTNNEYKNLCLLCPNCHSQTSTYKGRNIGNGRFLRRKRYYNGKSY